MIWLTADRFLLSIRKRHIHFNHSRYVKSRAFLAILKKYNDADDDKKTELFQMLKTSIFVPDGDLMNCFMDFLGYYHPALYDQVMWLDPLTKESLVELIGSKKEVKSLSGKQYNTKILQWSSETDTQYESLTKNIIYLHEAKMKYMQWWTMYSLFSKALIDTSKLNDATEYFTLIESFSNVIYDIRKLYEDPDKQINKEIIWLLEEHYPQLVKLIWDNIGMDNTSLCRLWRDNRDFPNQYLKLYITPKPIPWLKKYAPGIAWALTLWAVTFGIHLAISDNQPQIYDPELHKRELDIQKDSIQNQIAIDQASEETLPDPISSQIGKMKQFKKKNEKLSDILAYGEEPETVQPDSIQTTHTHDIGINQDGRMRMGADDMVWWLRKATKGRFNLLNGDLSVIREIDFLITKLLRWSETNTKDDDMVVADMYVFRKLSKNVLWCFAREDDKHAKIYLDLTKFNNKQSLYETIAHEWAHSKLGVMWISTRDEWLAWLMGIYAIYKQFGNDIFEWDVYMEHMVNASVIWWVYGNDNPFRLFTPKLKYQYNLNGQIANGIYPQSLYSLLSKYSDKQIDPHAIAFFCGWENGYSIWINNKLLTPQGKTHIRKLKKWYWSSYFATIEKMNIDDEQKILLALQYIDKNRRTIIKDGPKDIPDSKKDFDNTNPQPSSSILNDSSSVRNHINVALWIGKDSINVASAGNTPWTGKKDSIWSKTTSGHSENKGWTWKKQWEWSESEDTKEDNIPKSKKDFGNKEWKKKWKNRNEWKPKKWEEFRFGIWEWWWSLDVSDQIDKFFDGPCFFKPDPSDSRKPTSQIISSLSHARLGTMFNEYTIWKDIEYSERDIKNISTWDGSYYFRESSIRKLEGFEKLKITEKDFKDLTKEQDMILESINNIFDSLFLANNGFVIKDFREWSTKFSKEYKEHYRKQIYAFLTTDNIERLKQQYIRENSGNWKDNRYWIQFMLTWKVHTDFVNYVEQEFYLNFMLKKKTELIENVKKEYGKDGRWVSKFTKLLEELESLRRKQWAHLSVWLLFLIILWALSPILLFSIKNTSKQKKSSDIAEISQLKVRSITWKNTRIYLWISIIFLVLNFFINKQIISDDFNWTDARREQLLVDWRNNVSISVNDLENEIASYYTNEVKSEHFFFSGFSLTHDIKSHFMDLLKSKYEQMGIAPDIYTIEYIISWLIDDAISSNKIDSYLSSLNKKKHNSLPEKSEFIRQVMKHIDLNKIEIKQSENSNTRKNTYMIILISIIVVFIGSIGIVYAGTSDEKKKLKRLKHIIEHSKLKQWTQDPNKLTYYEILTTIHNEIGWYKKELNDIEKNYAILQDFIDSPEENRPLLNQSLFPYTFSRLENLLTYSKQINDHSSLQIIININSKDNGKYISSEYALYKALEWLIHNDLQGAILTITVDGIPIQAYEKIYFTNVKILKEWLTQAKKSDNSWDIFFEAYKHAILQPVFSGSSEPIPDRYREDARTKNIKHQVVITDWSINGFAKDLLHVDDVQVF